MIFLGKFLFPAKASWRRNQQTKLMLTAILVAVLFAAVVTTLMFFVNAKR